MICGSWVLLYSLINAPDDIILTHIHMLSTVVSGVVGSRVVDHASEWIPNEEGQKTAARLKQIEFTFSLLQTNEDSLHYT